MWMFLQHQYQLWMIPLQEPELDDGIVAYPDGAPPELIREKKEPDDNILPPSVQQQDL